MGFTTEWIRRAILDGVIVRGVLVRLDAETLEINGRRTYRIHEHKFSEFLVAIGWKHLPRPPLRPPPATTAECADVH
jgi:hypothetical protein